MKISVIGLGYVGLVTAAVLADRGNRIVGIDVNQEKIDMLNEGRMPIFEPGLEDIIGRNVKNITFTSQYDSVKGSEFAFIAVPTPTINGKMVSQYVMDAGRRIHEIDPDITVVIKSTVLPGTAKKLSESINSNVISNPEFLREGTAIHDTIHPDRVVIGGRENIKRLGELWEFTNAPTLYTTNENAELIKYASNAFLATKISFINQMADLCEKIPGADVNIVARGMGLDKRIGSEFLKAGLGYGGSCFPKDTKALLSFGNDNGLDLSIVRSTIEYNDNRVKNIAKNIENIWNNHEAKIGILGLSFKDNTDDLRESKSLELINELKKRGYKNLMAYDPAVKSNDLIKVEHDINNVIRDSDVLIVATEWPVFSQVLSGIHDKTIIDLRRIMDVEKYHIAYGVGLGGQN